jgi:membrane protease YdiL (CAAX protease family)
VVSELAVSNVLLAPVLEEGLFRALLLRSLLAGGMGTPAAVALQAAAFAVYHLTAAEFLPLFCLGCVLGGVYVWSGRWVGASVAAHALYNGATLTAILVRHAGV